MGKIKGNTIPPWQDMTKMVMFCQVGRGKRGFPDSLVKELRQG